jgi:hypothetical protein
MEIHIVPLTGDTAQDQQALDGAALQGFRVAATYADSAGNWYCIMQRPAGQ